MPSDTLISGTETTMSAIRLARGFTGRDVILKFAGCYHGHSDSLLVSRQRCADTRRADQPGRACELAQHLYLPYNDLAAQKYSIKR